MRNRQKGKRILPIFLAAVLLGGTYAGLIQAGETKEPFEAEGMEVSQDPGISEIDQLDLLSQEEDSLPSLEEPIEEIDIVDVPIEEVLPEESLLQDIEGQTEEIALPHLEETLDKEPEEAPYQVLEELFEEGGEELDMDLLAADIPYPEMEGKPITSKNTEYKLVTSGSAVYKGNYNLLGDENNKSKFVFKAFNNAGNDVLFLEHNGNPYFVPKSTEAAGKYGFLVENVGFSCQANCKLDMRFTVTDFKNYMLDKTGKKLTDMYPAFGFYKSKGLNIAFGGPDQNIRVEILKHGTNTPVKGDYSFRWLDIDAGQRFGINLINGELTGRYAIKTCSAYYENNFSRFNREYQMVYGTHDTDYSGKTGDWMDGTVYWEVKNCSKMNMLIASAGNSQKGRYTEEECKKKYESYLTMNFPDGKMDMGGLAWDGESYGPRENPTAIYKYVSNSLEPVDQLSMSGENTVFADNAVFYYYLVNHVPVESPGYYYDTYTVADTLPPGVKYDGEAKVTKGETGGDVTSWFDIAESGGTISFAAKKMGSSSFYGSTFIFQIRVRMDKGGLSPSYVGNEAVYTVKNTASVTSKHKTDTSASSLSSNEVVTTLRELEKGRLTVRKTSPEGAGLGGAVYEVKARDNILSPAGEVLVPGGTVIQNVATGNDGNVTLDNLYAGVYVVTELLPPKGYCINTMSQEVEIHGPGIGMEPSQVIFTNEQSVVYIRKTAAPGLGETEKKVIPGVEFRIWNKENSREETAGLYATDVNGLIALPGLDPGTYCFREILPPVGYASDRQIREFVIDEKGMVQNQNGFVIEVENAQIQAEFAKTDRSTGAVVAGANLALTNEAGDVVETWVSENTPHLISAILPGTYLLTEISPPLGYKKSQPVVCVVEDTPQIQSYQISDVKYVDVELVKTMKASDIVWSQGNPSFTLCFEGTDLDGETYSGRQTVEFTKEEFENSQEEYISLKAVFSVPAGNYAAWEKKTARYRLKSITPLENAEVFQDQVTFDLRGGQNGKAEFVNEKTTDAGLTDTDFVRNVIIRE